MLYQLALILTFALVNACASKSLILTQNDLKEPIKRLLIDNTTANDIQIRYLEFEDLRNEDEKAIGIAKTGMFNVATPIYLYDSTKNVVKERFVKALSERGVSINKNAKYAIIGQIKKLWITEDANGLAPESANCDLKMDLILYKNQVINPTYKFSVYSYASGTNNIIDATNSDGPILETCIQYAANKFLEDSQIKVILKK